MDDARAGLPETDAVLRTDRPEELIDLRVHVDRGLHVRIRADARLDQVVAVNGARYRNTGKARQRELQQRHLRGRVLHGDAIRPIVAVVHRTIEADGLGIVGVCDQDLLGEAQPTAEATPGDISAIGEALVRGTNQLDGRGGDNGGGGLSHG